mmetsp:Transcript_9221/g.17604  ORF Transcript_9221/g.17604 Transcript_9221/m.17604 type:complete len:283 (-) Transcript_9221:271-1119(-)
MRPGGCFGAIAPGQDVVETLIFTVRNTLLFTSPNGRIVIQTFPCVSGDFLHFGFLFFVLDSQVVFGFFIVKVGRLSRFFLVFHGNLHSFRDLQKDRMDNKFGIPSNEFRQAYRVGVFQSIFLQMQRNFGTSCKVGGIVGLVHDKVSRAISRFPYVHVGIGGVFGLDADFVGDQKCRVKAHTELSNLRNSVGIFFQGFQELTRTTPCDGTQVAHQIVVRHTDTCITQGQRASRLVEGNANFEGGVRPIAISLGFRQCQIPILVQGICSIGNQFTHKDFLVLVK